ncbi:MAG: TolB-like 6-bladed beta-propeller domain-containing protein [Prevotellaceae bacterium]|nr:TolB-like 6-bladed beta-propeller domain-containing protein [Prevotellaceae bacterium]
MKKLFILIIMFAGLISCDSNNNDLFTENYVTVSRFKKEKQLEARVLIDEAYGYDVIGRVDGYLVLFSTQREYFFYVYNLIGDSLGGFGVRGQGPADLTGNGWCGQTYGNSMWINDVNRARMCAVNVEQSLAEKQCVFDTAIRSVNFSVNSFVLNDSIMLNEQMKGDNYYFLTTNFKTEEAKEEKVYKYPVDRRVFNTYKSRWRLKPDCSKMASAMHSNSMINILDIGTKERKSIITGRESIKIENIVDPTTGHENRTYYATLDVTDNYIYALYMNQNHNEAYNVEKEMEIHVFDWQGTPVCKYTVPQYIWSIAVDENIGHIYAFSPMLEQVYVYEIEQLNIDHEIEELNIDF